jgi:vacuolar-type H+-ATPase subunit I/STV1
MTGKSTDQTIRKLRRHWLLAALVVSLAWLSFFVVEVVVFGVYIREFPTPFRIAAVVIPLVVLVGVALLFLMGTKIIPWRYGTFGPYECMPRPKYFHPHICIDNPPCRPHYVSRYEIGREGIELTYLFGSRAFLPAELIRSIGPAADRLYVVEHDSPEISGPLLVSHEVGEAILAGLGQTASSKSN